MRCQTVTSIFEGILAKELRFHLIFGCGAWSSRIVPAKRDPIVVFGDVSDVALWCCATPVLSDALEYMYMYMFR